MPMLEKYNSEPVPPLSEGAVYQDVSQYRPGDLINANVLDFAFTKEVQARSGVNLNSCWHCL